MEKASSEGKVFAALGVLSDPKLETALVEGKWLILHFEVMHTASIRVIMVCFNLGVIVMACNF